MRFLHVSDFHLHKPWFSWVAENARHYDATCITGDFLDMFQFDEAGTSGRMQIRWVQNWVKNFPGKLFLISGNHDFWVSSEADPMAEGGWLQALRRPGVTVDGDSEVFGGWTFFCKPWVGGIPPRGKRVVLLAHAPPEGLAVSGEAHGSGGDFEATHIARGLPRGSIMLSGHIHRPTSWHDETQFGVRCYNPGVGDRKSPVPNHIVIDLDRLEASFYGWGEHQGSVSLQ